MNANDGNNWKELNEDNECERNVKHKIRMHRGNGYRCKRNMYGMLKQIQRKQNQTDKKLNLIASILMSKLSGQNEFMTEQFEISYTHKVQQNEDINVNNNNNKDNKVVVNVQMEEKIIESSNNNNNNSSNSNNNNPNKFSNVLNMNDDETIKNLPQQQQQQPQSHHINLQKYKIEQEEIIETINIDKEMNINQLVSEQDPNNNNNNTNSECVSRSDYSQISNTPQDNCGSLQSSSSSTKTKKIRGFNFNMKKKKVIDSVSSSYSKDNTDPTVINSAKEVKKFDIQRFTIKQKQDKPE